MLSIQPKSEKKQDMETQLNKFEQVKTKLIKATQKKEEQLIREDISPRLRHHLALMSIIKRPERTFHFTMPLMSFDGYDLTEEEKEAIKEDYYFGYQKGRGISKVIKKVMRKEAYFKSVTIEEKTQTVAYELNLFSEMEQLEVEKEQAAIFDIVDAYVSKRFIFQHVVQSVQACYDILSGDHLVELFPTDLENFPVLILNLDSCLPKDEVYDLLAIPNHEAEIDFRHYVKHSKELARMKRKAREYGYRLRTKTCTSKSATFREHMLHVTLDMTADSKACKRETMIRSEEIQTLFEQKRTEYDEILKNKLSQQNDELVSLVEKGRFDTYVATTWSSITTMSTYPIIHNRFARETRDTITFSFHVPFDRTLPSFLTFPRASPVHDGIGKRYVENTPDNLLDTLEKRYPFLQRSQVFKREHIDYQVREEKVLHENLLAVEYEVHNDVYRQQKTDILQWVGTYFGVLAIDEWLNEMELTDEGISEKINGYVTISPDQPFRLVLGTKTFEEGLALYQGTSLAVHTQELFESKGREEYRSYKYTNEYLSAKATERKQLKIANLLTQALLIHPRVIAMKEALAAFDYDLVIQWDSSVVERMKTGDTTMDGDPQYRDINEHSVSLVIQ